MDSEPWHGLYDRDIDVPRRARDDPMREPFEPHRRLVINPLLPIVGGLASIGLLKASLRSSNVAWFLAGLAGLGLSCLLTQFHCLDCGRTIWVTRRWQHACPPALARWREGRRGRWPFPDTWTQIILWIGFLGIALGLLLIIVYESR